jgi:hypothetical protein
MQHKLSVLGNQIQVNSLEKKRLKVDDRVKIPGGFITEID